jgi:uncharacterized membrane protein
LGGLGISFLVASGIWISLKRKAKNVQAQQLGKWKYPNILIVILMFGFMYYSLFSSYSITILQFNIITVSWAALIIITRYLFFKNRKRRQPKKYQSQ